MYDATISFSVEDQESAIADVNATLQDYGGTIPSRAYPAEPSRTLQLTSSQTLARTETYSAAVIDLKGGKEYRAKIAAKDSAGNLATTEFETPYVREFENLARKDNVVVGAYYYPWYNPGDPYGKYFYDLQERSRLGFESSPLLGPYDSRDGAIINKHIDWATGYGIDFFLVSWGFFGPDTFADLALTVYANFGFFIWMRPLSPSGGGSGNFRCS